MGKIYEDEYFIFDYPKEKNLRYYRHKVKAFFYIRWYKLLLNIFAPKVKKKKFYVSFCAIFKDEAKYLREWIEFHKIVGVEHFYLYNNFSNDNYLEILQPYIDQGVVTLNDWPIKQGQMSAYYDCLEKKSQESSWIGFIDIDEFVVPDVVHSICEVLRPFEKNRAAVLLYWKIFGSSGKVKRDENQLVTESFTVAWPKLIDIGKCFLNTNYVFAKDDKRNNAMHLFWGKYKQITIPPANVFGEFIIDDFHKMKNERLPAHINHYFTKSFDEYLEKKKRGDAFFEKNPRDLDYFYGHEMKCQMDDKTAYKYLIKLKKEMGMNDE